MPLCKAGQLRRQSEVFIFLWSLLELNFTHYDKRRLNYYFIKNLSRESTSSQLIYTSKNHKKIKDNRS